MNTAHVVFMSSSFAAISMRKRSCVINEWGCPWFNKRRRIAIRGGRSDAAAFGGKSTGGGDDGTGGDDDGIEGLFPIGANMTYVQYTRGTSLAR